MGERVQGAPRGRSQLNPPCWLVTAPAPRQEGTRAEGRAHTPPKPGHAPPHAWCRSTLPPSQGTPWGRRSPSHHSAQWAHIGKDSWARGWRMPGVGWSSGTHLHILRRGSPGASWKGAPGARWKGSTQSQTEGKHQESDGRGALRDSWKGAPGARWKGSTGSQTEGEHSEPDGRGAPGARRKGSTESQMEGEHWEPAGSGAL